jgi:hypothetical protein
MIDVVEFRDYLKIHKHALDDDLRRQPSLLFAVSDACEEALAERDKLKDQLAVCEAGLDASYRKTLKDYTEGQIKGLIINDKARRQAHSAYHKARQTAGQLLALKDAFRERGYMLREMCSLYCANYYETNSSRPTPDTDRVTYQARKAKMSEARQREQNQQ